MPPAPVRLGADVRHRALCLDPRLDSVGVFGPFGHHRGIVREPLQKRLGGAAGGRLAQYQQEG